MSNFMKVSQSRRKHPPFVSGRLAFSFALGLMAFAPSPVLGDSRYLVGIGIYFGKPKKKETFIYNSS